jgi:hypothetical protein
MAFQKCPFWLFRLIVDCMKNQSVILVHIVRVRSYRKKDVTSHPSVLQDMVSFPATWWLLSMVIIVLQLQHGMHWSNYPCPTCRSRAELG